MAMTFHVDVVSAEQEIYSGNAEMIFAPAEMGEVGVMPRHAPMLTRLRAGEVRVRREGEEEYIFVSGGMLEIQPHHVTVLADTAARARDLDEAAAQRAKEEAERKLHEQRSEMEYAQAEAELAEAIAQIRAIERYRRRGR